MDFEELKRVLFERTNFGMKLGLERMQDALQLLGNPERCAPALHVAGTNGKGSTCAFAEASLRAAGLRTGLYTSPHLNHFCERIRLDGQPISESSAAALLETLLAKVPWALRDDGLTFFELATLLAFLAFAEARVDVMVIEVGLGGRLDATNVLEKPAACAVAALGLEHTQHLGPTLSHIAREKAGIFKAGSPAVSAGQPLEAAQLLQRRADSLHTMLWRPGRDYAFESRPERAFCYQGPEWTVRPERLSLPGHHQRGNAALACALLEAARLPGVTAAHAAQGLASAVWPARLEQVLKDVYVDGAHNPHAAAALARALPELLQGRPLRLVFGALQDKDAAAMLHELGPLAASVHYCAPDTPRALAPEVLEHVWPGQIHDGVPQALAAARAEGGVVLCCGSLYLAGEARAALLGQALAPMPADPLFASSTGRK